MSGWELQLSDLGTSQHKKMGKLSGFPIVTNTKDISAGYGIVASDQGAILKVTATGADLTISFASAGVLGNGFHIWIKRLPASTHNVILDPAGAETIDGEATLTLTQTNEVVAVSSDGINLYVTGKEGGILNGGGW